MKPILIKFETKCKKNNIIDHLEYKMFSGRPEEVRDYEDDLSERRLELLYDEFNIHYYADIESDGNEYHITAYQLVEEAPWGYGDVLIESKWYLDDLPADAIYKLMTYEESKFDEIFDRKTLEVYRNNFIKNKSQVMAGYIDDVLKDNKKCNYFHWDDDEIVPLTTEDMCDYYKEYSSNHKFIKKHS